MKQEDNKKEFKIFIVVIGVLILLLIFEMFFFKGRPEVAEEVAKAQEQLAEMASETIDKEQKTVYQALTGIIDMMNAKDYAGLYAMLKDDYKNYYFSEYSSFEEFMKSYAKEEYIPKYNSYYRDGDLYYIMVDFLKPKYTRQDLLSLRFTKVDTIILEEVSKGNFKFAMNGFVENMVHNNSKTINGVEFTLLNSVRNTETMKTTVLVSNKSDKKINISTSNINPEISGSNTSKISVTSLVTIDPGSVGTISIEYYFQYNAGREFRGVTFSGVKFEDGTIIEDFSISK